MVDCSGCAGCDDYCFCRSELSKLEKQDTVKHKTWRLKMIKRHRNKALGVKQCTLSGGLVATYISQKAAAIATNISKNAISLAINGNRRHAGGFRWVAFELPEENKQRRIRDEILKREAEEYISYINRNEVVDERTCLLCGKSFMSKGNRNRRCTKCDGKVDSCGQERLCSVHTDEPVLCG